MRNTIRSNRNLALMLTLASLATGATFVGSVVALPGTAYAAEREAFPSEVVHYHDLDLTTENGAAKLHSRVYRAAKRVCGYDSNPLAPRSSIRKTCLKEASHDGLAKADQKIAQYRVARMAKD
jgi:UrcA family protein